MSNRQHATAVATKGQVVTVIGLVGLMALFVRALQFTPTERFQGLAQKIYYIHVPSAVTALTAFVITGVLSIGYLWLKDMRMDRAAAASAEVGVAFGVVMMTTGPLWGKPVWGTWWQWDARLTSTLFLFLLFVGYLVMRGSLFDQEQRGRFSAVLGIMGMVLVPFVHLTVYLFRGIHPQPIVLKPSAPSLPTPMLITLLLGFAVFYVLYTGLVMQRYALAKLSDIREQELNNAT